MYYPRADSSNPPPPSPGWQIGAPQRHTTCASPYMVQYDDLVCVSHVGRVKTRRMVYAWWIADPNTGTLIAAVASKSHPSRNLCPRRRPLKLSL